MQADSVLRRKLGGGAPKAATEGVEKAFRIALARAAQVVPGFRIEIPEVVEAHRSLAELLELLPERALLAMLEGPGEALGLAALDQPALSALIEAMTTGRIGPAAPAPRKPTRTDAAMAAGLVDRTLQALENELVLAKDRSWAGGFHYASFLDDPRPLELLLEDTNYRVFQARLALGPEREGVLLAALPAHSHHHAAAASPALPGPAEAPATVEAAALAAEAELTAVLDRLVMPLSAVLALKPGDVLAMPAAAIDAIGLEALDGERLAEGKLGQNRGSRAVRLGARATPSSLDSMAEAPAPAGAAPAPPAPAAPEAGFTAQPMAKPEPEPEAEVAAEPLPMALPDLDPEAGPETGPEPETEPDLDPEAEPAPIAPIAPVALTG